MTESIEGYCDEIEQNVDRIYRNAEDHSDEVLDMAYEFRNAANEIRSNSEAANEKYFELKDRAVELNRELERSYQALEKMATIEEQHKKTRKTTRRAVLAGTGAVLLGGAAGTAYLASKLEGEKGLQEGEWYSFSDVENCLSENQENTLRNNIDEPLDETSYRFEKEGGSRSEGWNIYLADSNGQDEFGVLKDQDIYCEVN